MKHVSLILLIFSSLAFLSCRSVHGIKELPTDTYQISAKNYAAIDSLASLPSSGKKFKIDVEQNDSILHVGPLLSGIKPFSTNLDSINDLTIYRYSFDMDILTIPFKIRPSVKDFPEQLDANFSAALYLGRRKDKFTITRSNTSSKQYIKGVGYGYGGFIGMSAVTINPFVVERKIDYEYSGFVLDGGIAGIYDAKKFNLGIALGIDYLVDQNRKDWIYQGKPWCGVLFGINLN